MKVVITIPAYNEESTIARVITDIKDVMNSTGYNFEILVVNDGSKDNTSKIAREAGAIVYSHAINYGLAETFKTEMKKCLELNADIIIHTDADGQYSAEDIPRLIKKIEEGYDLVLGSRFKGKIESMPFINRIGNIAFSKVVSQVTNSKISDAQTGLRAFTKDIAKIEIKSKHTYTQEQVIRAIKLKYKIKEVPINFGKRNGKSRLIKNPFDYATKAWIDILSIYRDYQPLRFFGMIGSFFFVIGFIIGLWLVYRFITTGLVGRLPFVMLTVLLISIGIQIILFGFLADMYKN